MADIGTFGFDTSASISHLAEVTLDAITVASTTGSFTLGLPAATTPIFSTSYPIGAMVLSQADADGATNALPTGVGIKSIALSGSTLTVNLVNVTGGSAEIPAGRWIFFQIKGEA